MQALPQAEAEREQYAREFAGRPGAQRLAAALDKRGALPPPAAAASAAPAPGPAPPD